MRTDLDQLLQSAATPRRDPAAPDVTMLWQRAAARRRRRGVTVGTTVAAALVGAVFTMTHLAAADLQDPPFLGQPSKINDMPSAAREEPLSYLSVDPFLPGQPLHCSEIRTLPPAQADPQLRDLGYIPEWRYMDGSNQPYPDELAPDGAVIIDASLTTDGTMFLFTVPAGSPDAAQADRYGHDCG